MIVYETASRAIAQSDLNQLAGPLAKHLCPHGEFLSSEKATQSFRVVLKNAEFLVALEIFERAIEGNDFEQLLRSAADLEAKRKSISNPSLKEIGLYCLAPRVELELARRIPRSLVSVSLFEWSLIEAHADQAILIRKITGESDEDLMPISQEEVSQVPREVTYDSVDSSQTRKPPLSTPELIALARFGKELREKRTHP